MLLSGKDFENLDNFNFPEFGAIYAFFEAVQIKQRVGTNVKRTLNNWLKKDPKIIHFYVNGQQQGLKILVLPMQEQTTKKFTFPVPVSTMEDPQESSTKIKPVNFTNWLGNTLEDVENRSKEINRIFSTSSMEKLLDTWQIQFLVDNKYRIDFSEKQVNHLKRIEFQINDSLGLN